MLARAETLTAELLRLGITKYNCYTADSGLPDTLTARLHSDPRPKVLLIDQSGGISPFWCAGKRRGFCRNGGGGPP